MSGTKIQVSYEDQGHKGRYAVRVEGAEGEGELTISKASDSLVIADHTYAPESLRGTGAASALVLRLIEDARARGWRVIPLCPYVKAQALRHPEWADVIQG
ncbi:GNAT family N-acetyltransferase [Neomegalonema sp.]|uniref:GNAT family N-acetyltransferase n=1 Tax=Neomegalonema sp. TaxID=2039713 RepID=UPI00262C5EB4|nr:GNAT family N-acetyltransferase [Neomegalonema sp.]MDD2868371.1 GNAT family N-acetyltransferase [Neomegalonema sp.]